MDAKETQPLKIDLRKLYTKMEYSKAFNISRPTIDKKIEQGEIKVVTIKGATLVVVD